MYRIEVNPDNIGVELETPFSLNPTRVGVANDPVALHLLAMLVDISKDNDLSLFDVCHAAVQQNIDVANYLPGIWEVMMEMMRPAEVKYKRTDCAFFFKKLEDAREFQRSYPGMLDGQLCQVQIIDEKFSKECDMNWIESINENTVKAKEALGVFNRYWLGEMTDKPIVEILFVGKYKLSPID